jgi:hypothetical protein
MDAAAGDDFTIRLTVQVRCPGDLQGVSRSRRDAHVQFGTRRREHRLDLFQSRQPAPFATVRIHHQQKGLVSHTVTPRDGFLGDAV